MSMPSELVNICQKMLGCVVQVDTEESQVAFNGVVAPHSKMTHMRHDMPMNLNLVGPLPLSVH